MWYEESDPLLAAHHREAAAALEVYNAVRVRSPKSTHLQLLYAISEDLALDVGWLLLMEAENREHNTP